MTKKTHNIKNLLPRKNSRYKQGYYDPCLPMKYVGSRPIIYRSSWEKMFMDWCERNVHVIDWGSEITQIPYFDLKGGRHTYNIDFTVRLDNGITLLVEVKPSKDIPRTMIDAKSSETKLRNFKKWEATQQYVKTQPNTKFVIVTENFFGK